MTCLEKNKKILLANYPGLYEEICKKSNDGFLPDIKIESTAVNEPTLSINGIYIHSQRDPLREAQRLAESVSGENGAVIILGFGLGYTAQAAASLGRPVIIAEKNKSLLLKALELRDFSDFLSKNRVLFVIGGNGDGITSALKIANDLINEKKPDEKRLSPSVIRNKALIGLDENWYKSVEKHIRTWTMKDEVNTATHKRFGQRWIRNISRNMSAIRDYPGISYLENFASVNKNTPLPVFLTAAGPSLDKIKPLLQDIYDRCVIVAVDTSLRFFIQNGIQPDFTIVTDPQFWNSRHLDRCIPSVCMQTGKQTALIAEPAVYPHVLNLPFKNKFLCSSMFALGSFIEKQVDIKGKLGAGGSVATSAWDFSRIIGANEIWITGLDLAFPGLKTHFRGARFEALSNSQSCRLNPVEKWVVRALRDGGPFYARKQSENPDVSEMVLTDKRLSLYAAWFENAFRQYPEIKNFCLFPEGLAINGLQSSDLQNFLELPKRREEIDNHIQEVFKKTENEFNNPEDKKKRVHLYEKAILGFKDELENISSIARIGTEIAQDALKDNLSLSMQDRIFKQLEDFSRTLSESSIKEIIEFILPLIDEEQEFVSNKNDDSFRNYLKIALKEMSAIAKTSDFLLQRRII